VWVKRKTVETHLGENPAFEGIYGRYYLPVPQWADCMLLSLSRILYIPRALN